MPTPDPVESARAFFSFHLRLQREARHWSQTELGAQIPCSTSLVSGIETCMRTPSQRISTRLDEAFGLTKFFEALHPRVVEESGLPAGFNEFTDAESTATLHKLYENFAITGLFQTPEYARAVLSAGQQLTKLDQQIQARLERQEILNRDEPPVIFALMEEMTIRRVFGGEDVMRGQLAHLLELMERPNIHILIVPFSAQICPEGTFTILSTPGEPDTGYAEMAGGRGRLIDSDQHVSELGILFELIRSAATSPEQSRTIVCNALKDLEKR